MIAKCENCGLIPIRGMRKMCPTCRERLTRPSVEELRELGEGAMDRARAAACLIRTSGRHDREYELALFMWAIHGRKITRHQAQAMLG